MNKTFAFLATLFLILFVILFARMEYIAGIAESRLSKKDLLQENCGLHYFTELPLGKIGEEHPLKGQTVYQEFVVCK